MRFGAFLPSIKSHKVPTNKFDVLMCEIKKGSMIFPLCNECGKGSLNFGPYSPPKKQKKTI